MMDLGHGANSAEVALLYGKRQESIIDFSSNINPFVSEHLESRLQEALKSCTNYPDIHYRSLRKAISEYLDCQMEQIIPGNGATEIMYLLMKALGEQYKEKGRPFRLGIMNPTFSEYERSAKLNGLEVIDFALKKEEGFVLDDIELQESLDEIDGLFICNPNNPTGNCFDLKKIAVLMQESNKLLIVDETFMEFVEEEEIYSLMPLISKCDQLIIIKAITKFFGLPGLRLGYGISSNEALLRQMYYFKEPWSVNGFAEHLTEVLLQDRAYKENTKTYFKAERPRVVEALSEIEGLKVYPTATNFILIQLERLNSAQLKEEMIKDYHILIRDASNFKGLDEHFIRVAIKGKADNDQLIEAMKALIK